MPLMLSYRGLGFLISELASRFSFRIGRLRCFVFVSTVGCFCCGLVFAVVFAPRVFLLSCEFMYRRFLALVLMFWVLERWQSFSWLLLVFLFWGYWFCRSLELVRQPVAGNVAFLFRVLPFMVAHVLFRVVFSFVLSFLGPGISMPCFTWSGYFHPHLGCPVFITLFCLIAFCNLFLLHCRGLLSIKCASQEGSYLVIPCSQFAYSWVHTFSILLLLLR